jgi:hypothetical protein
VCDQCGNSGLGPRMLRKERGLEIYLGSKSPPSKDFNGNKTSTSTSVSMVGIRTMNHCRDLKACIPLLSL